MANLNPITCGMEFGVKSPLREGHQEVNQAEEDQFHGHKEWAQL